MRLLVVAVALLAACSGPNTIGPPSPGAVIEAPPSASPTTSPPPTQSIVPTFTPGPTTAPKPTLRPASLTYGTLHYTASGCFSTDWTDAQGHTTPGVESTFKLTVKNSGQVASDYLWIHVTSSDWFDSRPSPTSHSWPGQIIGSSGPKELYVRGPHIGPGKTATVSWGVLFATPFDVHYDVALILGPIGSGDVPDEVRVSAPDAEWSVWTSNSIC